MAKRTKNNRTRSPKTAKTANRDSVAGKVTFGAQGISDSLTSIHTQLRQVVKDIEKLGKVGGPVSLDLSRNASSLTRIAQAVAKQSESIPGKADRMASRSLREIQVAEKAQARNSRKAERLERLRQQMNKIEAELNG